MKRFLAAGVALSACLLLAANVMGAAASTKFSYTETFDAVDVANLTVTFQEGSLKRFAAVDYRLDASAEVTWACTGGQSVAEQLFPSTSLVGLAPDEKGRVSGSATLDLDRSPAGPCPGVGFDVGYSNVTLTNLATGHTYRLDSIEQSLP